MNEKQKEPLMRRFNSYGPINPKLHYYVPREKLIEQGYRQLLGESPGEGGHYITVWAPRQTGKSWVMLQVLKQIQNQKAARGDTGLDVDVVKVDLDLPDQDTNLDNIAVSIAEEIFIELGKKNPGIDSLKQLPALFTSEVLDKPLILLIDEFDALPKEGISRLTRVFRNLYMRRQKELNKPLHQRRYLLHGLALIGVRSVLGIENKRGSPFNIQRSVHIPNLTYDETKGMFVWYEKESKQKVHSEVIDRLFAETRGQPGLTCWFGELLTETYNQDPAKPLTMENFEEVLAAAVKILPNNNILNIISKANEKEHKSLVLELFKTDRKIEFNYDDKSLNYLYMNGVIDVEKESPTQYCVRFSSPFVQKRLFNYFSREIFQQMGQLVEPFFNLDHVITPTHLEVRELLNLYQAYLDKNKKWMFKQAPRRSDMRVFEAVFHFNLYAYINEFLRSKKGQVFPEFPTGNGKIDLLIRYQNVTYGIELKSFTDHAGYGEALEQAAGYGKQLRLDHIYLVFFIESIDEKYRQIYEKDYRDADSGGPGVTVHPIFIETGKI
jgi:hypothetical protein